MPSDRTTHVDPERGLWISKDLREFTGQIVFRTPRATIQHFQSDRGELDAYYGLIDATHFGDLASMWGLRYADLAPRRVSIKPQDEDAIVLEVDLRQGDDAE
jgi:hypothetical protein